MLGLAVVSLVAGCASTSETRELLVAAGFKVTQATTPEQQAHLQTLPDNKVSMVERNGKQYFVYPDKKNNVLYIGQSAQYQQYENLRQQHQLAQEKMESNMLISDPGWNVWGPWPDTIYSP